MLAYDLQTDRFIVARKRMVTEQVEARGIQDAKIIEAMLTIPRHHFVDDALASQSYSDAPINIGESQTISQPYIVALMTQALELTGQEVLLEIGTGCGYQTAILSRLAKQVYTVERIKNLALMARKTLKSLGLSNIVMRVADGSMGWGHDVLFDRILLTCASPKVPENFFAWLKPNGILIAPVTVNEHGDQHLMRYKKTPQGIVTQDLGVCFFVKMIGRNGFGE